MNFFEDTHFSQIVSRNGPVADALQVDFRADLNGWRVLCEGGCNNSIK